MYWIPIPITVINRKEVRIMARMGKEVSLSVCLISGAGYAGNGLFIVYFNHKSHLRRFVRLPAGLSAGTSGQFLIMGNHDHSLVQLFLADF